MNRIFGFDPKTGLALISHSGSASEVFRLSARAQEELLGPFSKYKGLICSEAIKAAARELKELKPYGISFEGRDTAGYPPLLKECPDPPIGLYIRSRTPPEELWSRHRNLAIVGTRDITAYGKEWCTRTVLSLSETVEKPLIVSGLAIGTDICAHKTSIDCGLPTVAVMATGPEKIYPYRHRDFAERLWRTPGCALISDYPPGTAPLAVHFLRRNRIIAGMSEATILIESKIKGGGMMTSRLAFSYNRDVYALPGRADDTNSQGCNRLIREKIAEPLTTTEDLMESLAMERKKVSGRGSYEDVIIKHFSGKFSSQMLEEMSRVIIYISSHRGISVEEIALDMGLEYCMVAKIIGILESEGLISLDLLQRCSLEAKIFR